jgi:hypothetical protein
MMTSSVFANDDAGAGHNIEHYGVTARTRVKLLVVGIDSNTRQEDDGRAL